MCMLFDNVVSTTPQDFDPKMSRTPLHLPTKATLLQVSTEHVIIVAPPASSHRSDGIQLKRQRSLDLGRSRGRCDGKLHSLTKTKTGSLLNRHSQRSGLTLHPIWHKCQEQLLVLTLTNSYTNPPANLKYLILLTMSVTVTLVVRK